MKIGLFRNNNNTAWNIKQNYNGGETNRQRDQNQKSR